MSIVIYASVKLVEKVNERDCISDKPVGTDKLGHVDQVKLISLCTVQV